MRESDGGCPRPSANGRQAEAEKSKVCGGLALCFGGQRQRWRLVEGGLPAAVGRRARTSWCVVVWCGACGVLGRRQGLVLVAVARGLGAC